MPSGRYAVRGRSGDVVGTEDFRCAPGPMGWRYFSEIQRDEPTPHRETVDVVVDASWGDRPRSRIETGSHAIVLEPRDGLLIGAPRRRARRGAVGGRDPSRLPVARVQRDHGAPSRGRARRRNGARHRRRLPGARDASSRSRCGSDTSSLGGRPRRRRRPGGSWPPAGATRRSRPDGPASSGSPTTSSSATTARSSSSPTNRGRRDLPSRRPRDVADRPGRLSRS